MGAFNKKLKKIEFKKLKDYKLHKRYTEKKFDNWREKLLNQENHFKQYDHFESDRKIIKLSKSYLNQEQLLKMIFLF